MQHRSWPRARLVEAGGGRGMGGTYRPPGAAALRRCCLPCMGGRSWVGPCCRLRVLVLRVGEAEVAEGGIGCGGGGGACLAVCPAACPLPCDPPPLLPACFAGGGEACLSGCPAACPLACELPPLFSVACSPRGRAGERRDWWGPGGRPLLFWPPVCVGGGGANHSCASFLVTACMVELSKMWVGITLVLLSS